MIRSVLGKERDCQTQLASGDRTGIEQFVRPSHAVFEFTGTLTAIRTVTLPDNMRVYLVFNNTSGGFSLVFDTVGGAATVTVTNGSKATLAVDPSFDVIQF